jgi:outer membrane protein OmpA-like peptidoglycan-associated protein
MTTVGHGQYSPAADNSTKEGRAENRHTIIDLIPNDGK